MKLFNQKSIARLSCSLFLLPVTLFAEVSFNRDIRPILSENCFQCHGPAEKGRKAKLRLDLSESAYAERDGVRAIVPRDAKASEVLHRIRTADPDDTMPPPDTNLVLTDDQKILIERWIKEGAVYQGHWAFESPVATTKAPIRTIIDQGIQARLQTEALTPAPKADPETLIRRLSLDLRGLPPTLNEVDTFLADPSPKAWEALIDRFLQSPQCAERLALDWLDVARYSDTNGYSIDDHRDMWGWRDWVIHAFTQNKSYDRFIIEQLAGDLLPEATPEQKMATGFLRNSMNTHEGGTIAAEYRVAYIADKIDTVSTTFMGLTMKCAQCHDHKYDPISQKDYYRFFAFFNSATERGKGATNGNTAPTIEVASPLGADQAIIEALSTRRERINFLRANMSALDPEGFFAWSEEVLAQAPASTAPVKRAAKKPRPGFTFPSSGDQPEWIWAEKSGATSHLLIRKPLEISGDLLAAYAFFTCDNSADLYVNGKKLSHVDPWMEPKTVDITPHVKSGANIIAADAKNAGGAAGFIAWVQLSYADGKTEYVLTGPDWQWKKPAGDLATTFASNEGWKAPVSLGKHGVGPWNHLNTGGAPEIVPETSLAEILRTAPDARSRPESAYLDQEFLKTSALPVKRLHKALGIELGIIEKQIKDKGQTSVMVMDVKSPNKAHMLMRGEYDKRGEEVDAGVPAFFPQLPEGLPADRLALAKWLVSDDHPLTARVAVNRYWQMIFGTGIVRTAEDFGSQGEWPSHPKLLDALAIAFRDGGWDVKHLLKEIAMSKTYQQQSAISPRALEQDPYNRLLARAPRQRLQAELVRDNALAIGGLLDATVGGPSVYPEQPDGLWRQISHFGYGAFTAQAYFPDAGKPSARRSMYTFWKRTAPPPAMALFDAPTRETCAVRRLNTNTPLQALVLLNDPQFLKAARALADRMVDEGGTTPESRIRYAFRLATSRELQPREGSILQAAYARELERFTRDPNAARQLLGNPEGSQRGIELAAYAVVASTILNLNETITKQ